jgi:hypothetical protein
MSFAQLQHAYAAHGVATYPLAESKTPAIRGYAKVGLRGSGQLAIKFADATAAGFWAGPKNRKTVLDIDSTDDKLLADMEGRYGSTPLIGRTPSGGWHLFYRNAGEPRDTVTLRRQGIPVDILGAGNVVAPGSVVPKGQYQLIRGTLDDLDRLPTMRQGNDNRRQPRVAKGERNNSLFEYCRRTVAYCDDFDALLDAAQTWASNQLAEPLPAAEVAKTCKSVWEYRGGRRRIMNHVVESDAYATLKRDPYALALFAYLSAENGTKAQFWITDSLGPTLGWPRRSVPAARRALLDLNIVECIREARKNAPAVYKWKVGI